MVHLIGHVPRPQQPRVEVPMSCGENRIPRGGHDLSMNFLIQPEIFRQIAAEKGRLHLAMSGFQIADFRLGNIFAGEPSGERLKRADDLEQVLDIRQRQSHDPGAAIGKDLDQSFGGKYLQAPLEEGFSKR